MPTVAIPEIDESLCNLCGDCVRGCRYGAVSIVSQRLVIDATKCAYCGDCEDLCPMGAIRLPYSVRLAKDEDIE